MWVNEIQVRLKSKLCLFGDNPEFNRDFVVVSLCSLTCWPIAQSLCLVYFPFLSPPILVSIGLVRADCIIVVVLSVVAALRLSCIPPSILMITSPVHQP